MKLKPIQCQGAGTFPHIITLATTAAPFFGLPAPECIILFCQSIPAMETHL